MPHTSTYLDDEEARLDGLLVAGLSQAPPGSPARWAMFVGVDDLSRATRDLEAVRGGVIAEEVAKGTAGRSSVLSDPAGVAFCLWEAQEGPGAEVITGGSAWAMSSLHCPDPESAADVDAVAARAVELGGSCLIGPMDTPEHLGAVLVDPQGGVFGVSGVRDAASSLRVGRHGAARTGAGDLAPRGVGA